MERTEKSIIFIDTHIVLWLYDNKMNFLSSESKKLLNNFPTYISSMSILELQYLYEIGKSQYPPNIITHDLSEDIHLQVSTAKFSTIVQHALQNTWTRDPFDRIIVADAQTHEAHLITSDKTIRKHYKKALL